MRVLFLLSQIGAAVPSFHAASILSAVLKEAGHEVSLCEVKEMDVSVPIQAVREYQPDVVAATSVTQQLSYITQIITTLKGILPHCITVLGGTHAILRRDVIGEIPALDALCVNEGEVPFLEFLARVETGYWRDVPTRNFRIRDRDRILDCDREFSMTEEAMTALPFEDRELFPRWRETPKGVPLESLGIRPRFWISRGCLFNCSYCCVPSLRSQFPGKQYNRYPSVERALAEVEYVADRWTFRTYVIDDDTFTVRKHWILDWADKYPSKLRHLSYEVNSRPECMDDEIAEALAGTGCRLVKFGLESGDPVLRRNLLNRKLTDEAMLEAVETVRRYGMQAHTFCMVGFPNETRRQVWQTIRLNQRLRPERTQVAIYFPYPNSVLGDATRNAGLVTADADNYFEETVISNPYMGRWEVKVWARLFRFLTYVAYSPGLAWGELVGLVKKVMAHAR